MIGGGCKQDPATTIYGGRNGKVSEVAEVKRETALYFFEGQSFAENGIEKAARSGRLEYKQTIMRGDGFAYKVYPG